MMTAIRDNTTVLRKLLDMVDRLRRFKAKLFNIRHQTKKNPFNHVIFEQMDKELQLTNLSVIILNWNGKKYM